MEKIYKIGKLLSGNVISIGADEELINILNENERIKNCDILNQKTKKITTKKNRKKTKTIKIKKLRKIYKKKKIDFILCDFYEIKKYQKTFIKDSVYINKDMLYIYNVDDNTKDEIIRKYKRYNTKIEELKDKQKIILKIDNNNSKTNFFKDLKYLIIDTFFNIIDILSDILVN